MASMRDIKRRIRSVNSTQQITKAMYLVSSSKLNKARTRLDSTKPFFEETRKVISDVIKGAKGIHHPFLEKRPVNAKGIIVITGDRGLCGGYNANVNKLAMSVVENKEKDKVIAVGSKSKDFFKYRGNIKESFSNIGETPTYENALEIGHLALEMFKSGEVDEVYLVYTNFISTLASEPKSIKLLPLDANDFNEETNKTASALTIYEPSEEEVLEYIIPKYINTVIFGAMVESVVCELGARMTAMDSATENAKEMIDSLNLVYNRARQGAITQEITEIVSGSGIYG